MRALTRCGGTLLVAALLSAGAAPSCSEKTAGAIMLAFSTDLSVPKDIKAVGLYITQRGQVLHYGDYPVQETPSGNYLVRFPSTFAIVSNGTASVPVRIQLVAFRAFGGLSASSPFVMREAVTTVPTDRIALLRMPLQFIDSGGIVGDRPALALSSDCPDPQTNGYLDGVCAPLEVDSSKLPDYVEEEVFGGGKSNGDNAKCFDPKICIRQTIEVQNVTAAANGACEAAVPGTLDPQRLNFALVTKGEGVCIGDRDGAPCVAVLNRASSPSDRGGWRVEGGKVGLPAGVCAKLRSGNATSLVASIACEAKAAAVPICGPWGVPGATPAPVVNDAAPPVNEGGLDGAVPGVVNIGPPEEYPQGLALLNGRLYGVCRAGKTFRVDADDVDNTKMSHRILPTNFAGGLPDLGYRVAATRDNMRSELVVVTARGNYPGVGPIMPLSGTTRLPAISGGNDIGAPYSVSMSPSFAGWTSESNLGVASLSAGPGANAFIFLSEFTDGTTKRGTQLLLLPAMAISPLAAPAQSTYAAERFTFTGRALQAIASEGGDVYYAAEFGAADPPAGVAVVRYQGQPPGNWDPAASRIGHFPDMAGAGAQKEFIIGALAPATDGFVYFTGMHPNGTTGASDYGIYRLSKSGGATTPPTKFSETLDLTVGPTDAFNDIAVDGDFVYATTKRDVVAVPLKGPNAGKTTILATNEERPRALVVDNLYVYWTTLGPGTGVNFSGRVRRAPKPKP